VRQVALSDRVTDQHGGRAADPHRHHEGDRRQIDGHLVSADGVCF
jgi:hypothetical protein